MSVKKNTKKQYMSANHWDPPACSCLGIRQRTVSGGGCEGGGGGTFLYVAEDLHV